MNQIKFFIKSQNDKVDKVLELQENSKVSEIIVQILQNNGNNSEYKIFIEDEDVFIDHASDLKSAGIRQNSRIHCHKCSQIHIKMEYNGTHKEVKVSPSFTGDKIRSFLPTLFGITPSDANDLQLKISDTIFVGPSDHIGSFVTFPDCKLELSLVPKVNVQG